MKTSNRSIQNVSLLVITAILLGACATQPMGPGMSPKAEYAKRFADPGVSLPANVVGGPPNAVANVRVVDVGAGLCNVIAVDGGHYALYDAGWSGDRCLDAAIEMAGDDGLEYVFISHSDADHLGDLADILKKLEVDVIYRAGMRRDTRTWKRGNSRVGTEARYDASVINLQTIGLEPGTVLEFGDATLTLVAGWPEWTETNLSQSELRNAISLVVRLEIDGASVLFTGDTVGRRKNDAASACKDAEKAMVDNAGNVSLEADVIIAPHHGANNGSARCFIEAVDPEFVIFSAGHKHDHPSDAAAQRYLAHGVEQSKMFRTDLGDAEGGFEWPEGSISGCRDPVGDDDVDIWLLDDGDVVVEYRDQQAGQDC